LLKHMKIEKTLPIACGLLVLAGCGRTSTSTRSSAEEMNNPPLRAQTESTNILTPTSRDTNGANRIYPLDTNKTNNASSAPDNTGINKRDRSDDALTALDQGASESDREITRNIRKELVATDALSTTAKNVKVITRDGKVTLRGPVKTEEEQKAIGDLARGVTGVTSVDNQLEVKTNQ